MMFSLDLARELAVRSSSTKRRRFWLRPELSQPAAAVLRQVFIGPIGVCCCTWGHLTKGEIKYAWAFPRIIRLEKTLQNSIRARFTAGLALTRPGASLYRI